MKFAPLLAAFALVSLVAACDSLDNPFHTIMNTGRDARVYNGATGNWEWPSPTPTARRKPPTPTPKPTPTVAAVVIKTTPIATPKKAAFPQGTNPVATPSATPDESYATPAAIVQKATPTPIPKRATGVLNMQTGKIEWTEGAVPQETPRGKKPKPTPTPKSTPTPKPTPPTQ
jgi:hypothetical protein